MISDEIDWLVGRFLDREISREELDELWVYLATDLISRIDIKDYRLLISKVLPNENIGNECFSNSEIQVLRAIEQEWNDALINEQDESFAENCVGIALMHYCSVNDRRGVKWFLQHIDDTNDLEEFIDILLDRESPYFAEVYKYLLTQGIEPIDMSQYKLPKMKNGKGGLLTRAQRNTDFKGGVIPLFGVSKDVERKSFAPKVHPSIAQKYPRLQKTLDVIAGEPAFSSVFPIIRQLISYIAQHGSLSQHIALVGPPGVGKTQSAQLLTPVLNALGVSGKEFYHFSPGKNTAGTVDTMAVEASRELTRLRKTGGVFFVDEAHKMYEARNGRDINVAANFRKRTLDSIIEQGDTLAKDGVVLIFAGYEQGLKEALSQDEGFARRFWVMELEIPTSLQLAQYVSEQLSMQGLILPANFTKNTDVLFSEMIADDSSQFGYWATINTFMQGISMSLLGDPFDTELKSSKIISSDDFNNAAHKIGFQNKGFLQSLDFNDPKFEDISQALRGLDTEAGFNEAFKSNGLGDEGIGH